LGDLNRFRAFDLLDTRGWRHRARLARALGGFRRSLFHHSGRWRGRLSRGYGRNYRRGRGTAGLPFHEQAPAYRGRNH
jgi:hypothetical protein